MTTTAIPATGLGLRLLAELERAERGNLVLSPFGLHRALAALREGASGAARAALDDVLGDAEPQVVREDPAVELALADGAWVDSAAGYEFAPRFRAAAQRRGIGLGSLDFASPAAAEDVNRWAAERTRGMVPRVLDRFEQDEHLVLANAAYLRGSWTAPFDPARTEGARFEGAGEVAMMAADGHFRYAEAEGAQAIRLPYGDGSLALLVMLPPRGSEPGAELWPALRPRMAGREGSLRLPRVAAESRLDLRDALVALGLEAVFRMGGDFDGLFEGPGPLKALGRLLQSARLEVDEEGTRAAAVTVATAVAVAAALDPPPRFTMTVDRPFLWAIEDEPTETLLFAGIVRDPGTGDQETT
jgi:serine protease inhibitor